MKINRRNFFRLLGVGAAAAAVTVSGLPVTAAAPVVPSPIDSAEDTDLLFAQFVEGHNDVLCYRLFTPPLHRRKAAPSTLPPRRRCHRPRQHRSAE